MTKVLLFRPNAAVAGGVVNYYSIVLGKLSDDIQITEFLVGRRAGLLGSKWLYPLRFVLDCLHLIWLLITKKFDVYHFNPSLNQSAYVRDWIFLLILRIFRKEKIIIFFRGWETDYYDQLLATKWKRKCLVWFLNNASRILVLASAFQEDLMRLGVPPEKIDVTSTTFDGAIFEAVDGDKNSELMTFLFMSRLIEKKGIFELVEAARILKSEGCQFSLEIAGSGPSEEALVKSVRESQISDTVHMTGYLRGSSKAKALLSSHVFLLPTYHGEGCPNCILEAMGAGLPIISTRVGGIPDIVKHTVNGVLLDRVNAEEIAHAMRLFINDKSLYAKISKENKRQAWELYESESVAKYLESVYKLVAANV